MFHIIFSVLINIRMNNYILLTQVPRSHNSQALHSTLTVSDAEVKNTELVPRQSPALKYII